MDQSFLKIMISIQLCRQKTNVPPKIDVYANTLILTNTHIHTKPERVKHIKTIGLVLSRSPSSLYHSASPSAHRAVHR